METFFKELHNIKDEFDTEADFNIFLEYLKNPTIPLLEMACVRGKDVKPKPLPFSFYFSDKDTVHRQHGIRVKIHWIDNKIKSRECDGEMDLHSDYEYRSYSHKYEPKNFELKVARNFFKMNKVLFAAAWEAIIDLVDLQHYFEGTLSFNDLIDTFDVKESYLYELQGCYDLEELEKCVRRFNMFNLND